MIALTPIAMIVAIAKHPPDKTKLGPSKAAPLLKQALAARKKGDSVTYAALLLAAKKILAEEGRFSCCIGKGGCDECALEGNCACAANLFAGKGVCKSCLSGLKAGNGRYDSVDAALLFEAAMEMQMRSMLGPWSVSREGSGTSWIPESSPMYGQMLALNSGWQGMQMGLLFGSLTQSGGPRGTTQAFGATQWMAMAQKTNATDQTVGLRAMVSLDGLTNGKQGYPNLFQTGETANQRPLKDRQHPHDLIMELSTSLSAPISNHLRGFVSLAPVGEPALGPSAFLHRPSAWDHPTAPIAHHWLDGTHITFGVATAGVVLDQKTKLEASAFNGREPNEDRFDLDPIRFNSYSVRLSQNPTPDLSFQASYGFLKSPEVLEPDQNQHKLTASLMHNRAFENGDNLASMIAFGQNLGRRKTSAFLTEVAYTKNKTNYFLRMDSTEKDELVSVPVGVYKIQKLSIGGVLKNIGASLDFYRFPSALKANYGNAPVGLTVFYRWRFGRM
jgi:hypothetical protein